MKLTAITVKNAKPKDKQYKLFDGGGLYLLVSKKNKYWRYDFRYKGKYKTLALGVYPAVSLQEARVSHNEAKEQLAEGKDPTILRKVEKASKISQVENSFSAVAEAWLKENKDNWSDTYYARNSSYLQRDAYPVIGDKPINEILAPEIIVIIKAVANRGAVDAAKRLKQTIGLVFAYGLIYGKCERNPVKDIDTRMLLPKTVKKHLAAIKDPVILGDLLRAIDGCMAGMIVKSALQLAPLVFLRPSELTGAEWKEIDLDAALWTLPAKRRKLEKHLKLANRPEDSHLIPLSTQSVEILKNLYQYTNGSKYCFPGFRGNSRPININTLRASLRSIGFDKETITPHGFRGTASTFLNTMGFRHDIIEAQLSHKDKNAIRAAYNHADYMDERASMMQDWANYLDSLRAGADVIPIKHQA